MIVLMVVIVIAVVIMIMVEYDSYSGDDNYGDNSDNINTTKMIILLLIL